MGHTLPVKGWVSMIKENQNLLNKINGLTDILILFISMVLAYLIRFYIFSPDTGYIKLDTYIDFTVLILPIHIIIYIFSIYIVHLGQNLLVKNAFK